MCKQSLLRLIESTECKRETQEVVENVYARFKDIVIKEMNRLIPYSDSTSKVRND